MPEFSRYAIESLRQPLEDGEITISRAQQSVTFPSKFMLIATSNPCPCGYLFSDKDCNCTPNQIQRYQKKLSGPILDRIDIQVTVGSVEHKNLLKNSSAEQSSKLTNTVNSARQRQYKRQNDILNSRLSNRALKTHAPMSEACEQLFNKAAAVLNLSPRSYIKTLKVARTVADLEDSVEIRESHITEALQYRPKQITY